MHNIPKVTLVGAGPGDPELLTLKGARALAEAKVILYDALANETILNHAPKEAIAIYVGKRKGQHSFSQDEINQLLVDNALTYGNVVRLKGGDPFVFGRGSEEIEFCASFGIQTEVIPGISSVVAVPASQGISITKRGISESFWVITGTTSNTNLSNDIVLAAQSSATIVVLMGLSKLQQIVSLFQEQGKGELSVAVIQNGTTSNERIGVGTINTIVAIVEDQKISTPALIIIGEVVRERSKVQGIYQEFVANNYSLQAR